jgi:hypothetical protein
VLDTEAVIDQVYQSWCRREAVRQVLATNISEVVKQSEDQLDGIVQAIRNPSQSADEFAA